jgi:hypothetical protein
VAPRPGAPTPVPVAAEAATEESVLTGAE